MTNKTEFDQLKIEKLKAKTREYIFKAQYTKAQKYLLKQKNNYPNLLFIKATLASITCETAFYKDEKTMRKEFTKAAGRLKRLLKLNSEIKDDNGYRNLNEYYWFSKQYKKQYLLGVKKLKTNDKRGYYSQGVGAVNYAAKLKAHGKEKESLAWAKKAEKAWICFFKYRTTKYYDPWAWYALSLGLQGKKSEMEKAIKKSAKLSLRSVQHPFLKKIRRMAGVN